MAEIPVGLRQPLPRILKTIRISGSTLSELPHDLPARWSGLAVLAIEDSKLKIIPPDFFAMKVVVLSLMGNYIERISADASVPSNTVILQLRLNRNPLNELPASLMGPNSLIVSFNVQNTSLSTFPTWVETQTKVVWAYDTRRFCQPQHLVVVLLSASIRVPVFVNLIFLLNSSSSFMQYIDMHFE